MKTISVFLIFVLFCISGTVFVCEAMIEVELSSLSSSWWPEGPNASRPDYSKIASFALKVKNIPFDYYKIDINLEDVTEWKGSCGNYPKRGAKMRTPGGVDLNRGRPDLKFLRADNSDWKYHNESHLSYKVTTQNHNATVAGNAVIRCYDYGAYAKLKVTVRRRDWSFWPLEGYSSPVAEGETTIPLDTNGNKIADGWENDGMRIRFVRDDTGRLIGKGGWNPAADAEQVLNTNNGDGYSVFDEYRGFWTGSEYKRLVPTAKDAFVCPEDDDGDINTSTTRDMWYYDDGNAEAIPQHSFHIIHQTYVNEPFKYKKVFNNNGTMKGSVHENLGWVNVNSENIPGYKRAWAIRIDGESVDPTERPSPGDPHKNFGDAPLGPPSQKSHVRIFYQAIRRYVNNITRSYDNAIIDPLVEKAIAHEIGHCVHLYHCSVPRDKNNNCIMQQQARDPRDVKTAFGGHPDGSHEIDYALTGSPLAPTAPDETQGEGVYDAIVDMSPDCDSCTTGGCSACPITYACGNHSGAPSDASSHNWVTPPCGDVTHAMYACQVDSDHSMQVASCSVTNSNGDTCTVTNYYVCQYHTHMYPAVVIRCGRSACTQTVSSANEHRVTCAAGHQYWSCGQYSNWLFHHHRVLTCRFTSCQQTWQTCNPNTPKPMCRAASRQGEKCWALPASQ